MKYDGNQINDPKEICEHFNDHFTSVAESIITNPKSHAHSPELRKFVDDRTGNDTFSFHCIQSQDVYNELIKLDVNKSTGLDVCCRTKHT